jgi:hypothetical protein
MGSLIEVRFGPDGKPMDRSVETFCPNTFEEGPPRKGLSLSLEGSKPPALPKNGLSLGPKELQLPDGREKKILSPMEVKTLLAEDLNKERTEGCDKIKPENIRFNVKSDGNSASVFAFIYAGNELSDPIKEISKPDIDKILKKTHNVIKWTLV